MKSILLKSSFLLLSVLFFSCQIEPLDPALASTVTNNNGGSNGANGSSNTTTADYWPSVINNTWNYNQNGTPQTPTKVVSTEVINGSTYYNFNNAFGQTSSATASVALQLKKNNGDYYIRIPGFTVNYGGGLTAQSTAGEFLMFKDYAAVNQTWTSTYNQTFTYNTPSIPATTTTVQVDGTMLEKNTTLTVNGVNFTNVIKFKIVQVGTIPGQPSGTATTSFYWFSKNVGCIKAITQMVGSPDSTTEITSYIVH